MLPFIVGGQLIVVYRKTTTRKMWEAECTGICIKLRLFVKWRSTATAFLKGKLAKQKGKRLKWSATYRHIFRTDIKLNPHYVSFIACSMNILIKVIKAEEMIDWWSNCITQRKINQCAISFSCHLSSSFILPPLCPWVPPLLKSPPSLSPHQPSLLSLLFLFLKSSFVSLECVVGKCFGTIISPISHIFICFSCLFVCFLSVPCLATKQGMAVSLSFPL